MLLNRTAASCAPCCTTRRSNGRPSYRRESAYGRLRTPKMTRRSGTTNPATTLLRSAGFTPFLCQQHLCIYVCRCKRVPTLRILFRQQLIQRTTHGRDIGTTAPHLAYMA
jgi:hypothetical protein